MAGEVRVVGLRELVADLRSMDRALPKQLRLRNRDVAAFLGKAARMRGMSLGGVHARMAGGIKWGATQSKAYISLANSSRFPSVIGAEFGAAHDRPRRVLTPTGKTATRKGWNFLPTRNTDGYMVYPTLRAKEDEIVEQYGDLVEDFLRTIDKG